MAIIDNLNNRAVYRTEEGKFLPIAEYMPLQVERMQRSSIVFSMPNGALLFATRKIANKIFQNNCKTLPNMLTIYRKFFRGEQLLSEGNWLAMPSIF